MEGINKIAPPTITDERGHNLLILLNLYATQVVSQLYGKTSSTSLVTI